MLREDRDGTGVRLWTQGRAGRAGGAARSSRNVAALPFIHGHVAVMPDVHFGIGATVGTVIPTQGAIIPAAVGVDIGCGMMAVRDDADRGATCRTRLARAALGDRARVPARAFNAARRARGAWPTAYSAIAIRAG